MIKANELRIGVNIHEKIRNKCGVHLIVREVNEDLLEVLFTSRNYDDFDGIPLTPEILEQCGFKRYDIGETDDENAWILPVDPNDENNYLSRFTLTDEMEYHFRDDGAGRSHYIKIESLHQLQNLCFALTGEEIEVNLNHTNPLQRH